MKTRRNLPVGCGQKSVSKINLVLFFGVAYLVFVNFYTSLTVLPLYVLELGGSMFDAGWQATLFYVTAILLRVYFGPMTDNRGRKIPLLVGAVAFGTAPLLFLLSTNLWALTLSRLYQAVGLAAFFSSGSSLVADFAPASRLGTYLGIYRMVNVFALLTGPPAAMYVINEFSYETWFVAAVSFGLLGATLMAGIKTPRVDLTKDKTIFKRFLFALKQRQLWPVYSGIAVISAGYGILLTFVSLFITQVTSISNPGIYFTYFAVAGIFATLSAGYLSDRFGRVWVVWPALVLLSIGTAVLYFLPLTPVALFLSSGMAGLGFAGGLLTLIAWLLDLVGEQLRGTVLAIQESTIDLFFGIGSFAFGFISCPLGLAVSFFSSGLVLLLLTIVLILVTPRFITGLVQPAPKSKIFHERKAD